MPTVKKTLNIPTVSNFFWFPSPKEMPTIVEVAVRSP